MNKATVTLDTYIWGDVMIALRHYAETTDLADIDSDNFIYAFNAILDSLQKSSGYIHIKPRKFKTTEMESKFFQDIKGSMI